MPLACNMEGECFLVYGFQCCPEQVIDLLIYALWEGFFRNRFYFYYTHVEQRRVGERDGQYCLREQRTENADISCANISLLRETLVWPRGNMEQEVELWFAYSNEIIFIVIAMLLNSWKRSFPVNQFYILHCNSFYFYALTSTMPKLKLRSLLCLKGWSKIKQTLSP